MFVERSIEILSPSLSEAERLNHRSRYRAIETAEDFALLYDDLQNDGRKQKMKMPAFTPIFRKSKV
jgi:predicted ATPase